METNQPEFQQIYNSFQPRILRYLLRMVGESEAEDLTQEVFGKVAKSLANFRGDAQLSTWIYRIATNTAMDRLRRTAAAPTIQFAESDEDPAASFWAIDPEPMVEAQVYRQEMNDCIRGFVQKLPENYRTVLVLGEFEGLKNEEIAEILSLTLDTVKIRLHRARERLKHELEANCGPEWTDSNEFLPEVKRTNR